MENKKQPQVQNDNEILKIRRKNWQTCSGQARTLSK